MKKAEIEYEIGIKSWPERIYRRFVRFDRAGQPKEPIRTCYVCLRCSTAHFFIGWEEIGAVRRELRRHVCRRN